jgi:hypothetical protein
MQKMMHMLILLSALMIGCKKDDQITPPASELTNDEVRLTVTIAAPGIQPTDTYSVVGGFPNPNYFNREGTKRLKKNDDGTYSIDIKKADLFDGDTQLQYIIYRNQTMEEVDANCVQMLNRILKVGDNLGKEVKITVAAFKGTGSCPP